MPGKLLPEDQPVPLDLRAELARAVRPARIITPILPPRPALSLSA